MKEQKKKILFIVNPKSGTGKQKKVASLIDDFFSDSEWSVELMYTRAAGEAPERSRKAADDGYDAVIAVGGDGTINEVARGLKGSNTALGIIPLGSGNGLARYLGISTRPAKALKTIRNFHVKCIDSAEINGRFFISVAGLGFDSYVAEQFTKSVKRGLWAYLRISISAYMFYQPRRYKIYIDGKPRKRRVFMISCANSNQFGFNAVIAPGAQIDDGLLDVCLVYKPRIYIAYLLIPFLFLKLMHKTPFLKIIRARHVVIYQSRKQAAHIDGDEADLGKRIEVRVVPQSIRVICPA